MMAWDTIDLDAYLHTRIAVTNDDGGRGHEHGVRVFDCPLCGDRSHRGWMSVTHWSAGCFNLGCDAEPRLAGGAVEWVRRVEGYTTRGRAWARLAQFPLRTSHAPLPIRRPPDDWCVLPNLNPPDLDGVIQRKGLAFISRQWGLTRHDAVRWSLWPCMRGRHAWRVIIPIRESGHTIAFQSRTMVPGVEPKYLTSRYGPRGERGMECGRPASGLLFNLDAVVPGSPVILVEGAGDAMAWDRRRGVHGDDLREVETSDHATTAPDQVETAPAVALLGTALTPEKIAMLHQKLAGGRVIVALDAELPTLRRAVAHVDDLMAWGIPADVGAWTGAKDAGAGGRLTVNGGPVSLRDRVARRIGVV